MSERIQNVQPRSYKGRTYRSTLEAKTAKVLDELYIPFKYEERKIILSKGFYCSYQKDKVRDITYTPDFEIGNNILIECKGFETPEWKIKKKLVFKYLNENEPDTKFYQIHDASRQLLEALDKNWLSLGYVIQVTSKPARRSEPVSLKFPSIKSAMIELNIEKPIGKILKSLIGDSQYVYGYNWSLVKINL